MRFSLPRFLAEDVTVVCPGDPEILVFAGVHETIDGFDDFWGKFFSVMERHDKNLIVDSMRLFQDGNQVALLTHEMATHVAGRNARNQADTTPIGFIFEFERGKLKRFEDHFDVNHVHSTILAARNKSLTHNPPNQP